MSGQTPQVAVSPVKKPMSSIWAHNCAGFDWAINKIGIDAYFVAGLIVGRLEMGMIGQVKGLYQPVWFPRLRRCFQFLMTTTFQIIREST